MTSISYPRLSLQERQADLRHELALTLASLKQHMNWAVISNAYGRYGNETPSIFNYEAAKNYALSANQYIDLEQEKAYRDVLCIVGWVWLDTGLRVYTDEDLRLHNTSRMDFYEVPMFPQLPIEDV